MKKGIGRKCRIVDCRETAGLAKTGGLAQRNTVAESPSRDVIAIAMGPGRRHITKPICEITYALREEGIDTSVIVLNAGSGVPTDAPARTMGTFGLEPEEIKKIQQFKLAVIHLGNVKNHIVYKARLVLRNVDIPAICVTQCPVDFEDFAAIGIKTREAMPPEEEIKTKGEIVEIISGIIRGEACPQSKLDEVIRKVKENLIIIEQKTRQEAIAD